MSGNERGGNNRRNFQRKDKNKNKEQWNREGKKKGAEPPRSAKPRGPAVNRPKWVAPALPSEPIPVPDCPYCGKPIRDITAALTDKNTGEAIHFDCVLKRLTESETLERGDAVTYIGGGRFGVVHFANPNDPRGFSIKRVFEWEDKESRADWRKSLADHFSTT